MILINKGGDANDISNWRPITIYSILRRVIEKALDNLLRDQVDINMNQRGFVAGIPGCHINARLINACLKDAKSKKKDYAIVFIDISKTFDHIGHNQIKA